MNDRLHELVGEDYTVKDLRTWTATVHAAVDLAEVDPPTTKKALNAAVNRCWTRSPIISATARPLPVPLYRPPMSFTSTSTAGPSRALATMSEHQVRRLPVIDGHDLVGMLAQADIARAMPEQATGETVQDISR